MKLTRQQLRTIISETMHMELRPGLDPSDGQLSPEESDAIITHEVRKIILSMFDPDMTAPVGTLGMPDETSARP